MINNYNDPGRLECPRAFSHGSVLVRSILVSGASTAAPNHLQSKYCQVG
jgi:hypothetical protein